MKYDQAGDGNYNAATQVTESVTAQKANQTITFGALANKTFGDPDFSVSATASSGLSVSFAATGQCTVTGATVHITGAGSCTITASQGGDTNYNPATDVPQSFNVADILISINDVSTTEGDSGTKTMNFTVTLAAASNLTVTVNFTTADGTATAPSDYLATSGTLTFNPGQTTKTISVTVNGDQSFEPDETFFINLSGATNATISDSQGLGTILNDDAQGGIISFSAADYTVSESGRSVTITVERSGDTTGAATVDYATPDDSNSLVPCATVNGIALSRCDFTTAIGTLKFAAGETTKTFEVLISQDSYVEGSETLSLTLSNLTGGAVFATPSTATLTITDDVPESATNPIDDADNFVRQHYHDFLNREPDAPGLAHWTAEITQCTDPAQRQPGESLALCTERKRANTSAAFFLSPEFQNTGSFIVRVFWGTLGKLENAQCAGLPAGLSGHCRPTYRDYIADMSQVAKGIVVNDHLDPNVINANKHAFVDQFVNTAAFKAKYDGLSNQEFVDTLFLTTGINASAPDRAALVTGLNAQPATETRSSVVFKVVDGTTTVTDGALVFNTPYGKAFYDQEFDTAFVFMEYIGYLRRNPDQSGYDHWLGKLKQYGNWVDAQMVLAFIVSPEYRSRFGQP